MDSILKTIEKYGLIEKGDKILVGFSGGPDSLALLLSLNALSTKLGLKLHIAHVDHNFREGSKTEAAFVRNWSQKLDIPASFKRLSPSLSKRKGSLEEIFREERLKFFIEAAKKIKAEKVALGHNLDDQAETILMRILRGTGLSGLTGISPKRNIEGVVFIRPLLNTPRKEIENFLKKRKVKPVRDPSNLEDFFFRNKIRNKLLPLLKKEYNQNISLGLANLAESVSFDYEYLANIANKKARGNPLKLKLQNILRLPTSILRLKLRQSIGHLQGNTRRINFTHIKEIEDLLYNRPTGSIVDLPKGVSVQKTRNYLRYFKR